MTKKRSIIGYEKLDQKQKLQLSKQYPDGFQGQLTQIKTPTGEIMDALIWETDDIIYLVKMTKAMSISLDEEDDEDLTAIEDETEADKIEDDEEE